MKQTAGEFGVLLFGLITSILVAILNVAIQRTLNFNLFSLALWFVVPIGAMLIGFASTSGFYFGSLYFHKRPSTFLLLELVAIAALTGYLIYYLAYITLTLDDGRKLQDLISLSQFIQISMTTASYSIGGMPFETGEVGAFGYVLAALRFVGLLMGSVFYYLVLSAEPACGGCKLYYRSLAKKEKRFVDSESAGGYYNVLVTHDVQSEPFAELIKARAELKKPVGGSFRVKTALLGCPGCNDQVIEDRVHVFRENEWKEEESLRRRISLGKGVDLLPVFQA